MFAFLRSKSQSSSPKSDSCIESPKTSDNEQEKQPTHKPEESRETKIKEEKKQPSIEIDESNVTITCSPSTAAKSNVGFEKQTKRELEQNVVHKAKETTSTINNCLRIAEDLKGDATRTLEALHQQGEKVHKTHETTITNDQDLKKGEKLLNALGGIFSKSWKARKVQEIEGPKISPDKEDKQKLAEAREPRNFYDKIEMEKAKQDDALGDLNSILGELKGMAVDMGSELQSQSQTLDDLGEDIEELNSRVKGANEQAHKLVAN